MYSIGPQSEGKSVYVKKSESITYTFCQFSDCYNFVKTNS